jgi:hypothetical protein
MSNPLQLVTNTHVNIVDLVDAGGTRLVTKFRSEKALSKYTLKTGKIFPRENIHAGGLLRALLRRILHPPDETENDSEKQLSGVLEEVIEVGAQGFINGGSILDILRPATDQRLAAVRAKALVAAKSRLEKLNQNVAHHG